MLRLTRKLFPAALLVALAVPAAAQQPAPAQKPTPPAQADCPRDQHGNPTKGVICPPNVDPGMKVTPPPETGSKMPVIPPDGVPGGDQKVQPK